MRIGAGQGMILSMALFLNRKLPVRPRILLGLLAFGTAVDTFIYSAAGIEKINTYPPLVFWVSMTSLLYGPMLYLYLRSIITERFSGKSYLLLLPGIILGIFAIIFSIQLPGAINRNLLSSEAWVRNPVSLAAEIAIIVFNSSFILASLLKIRKSGKLFVNYHSRKKGADLKWLQTVLFLALIIYCVELANALIQFYGGAFSSARFTVVIFIQAALFYFTSYRGLKQPFIIGITKNGQTGKYSRSTISDKKASDIEKKLTSYMNDEAPFLHPTLKLPDLAADLNTSVNHLSQVLNTRMKVNFYDFINSFRISEAKKLLAHPDAAGKTMLEIAYDSGFNSKSTFNSVFKDITGITPSQYRKSKKT